jgi:hypothetical protein
MTIIPPGPHLQTPSLRGLDFNIGVLVDASIQCRAGDQRGWEKEWGTQESSLEMTSEREWGWVVPVCAKVRRWAGPWPLGEL